MTIRAMLLEMPAPPHVPKGEIEFTAPDELLRGTRAEADLKLLFSKSNRILVQDVLVQPFTDPVSTTVLSSIQCHWAGPPQFKVLTARLSCIPSPDCKFTWLRVGFELGNEDHDTVRPIACSLFPESRQDRVKVTSSVEISSELTIEIAKTGSKLQETLERERREFNVNTYGAFSSTPAWDFHKTEVNPEVAGDLTLVMVVAQPQAATSQGQM